MSVGPVTVSVEDDNLVGIVSARDVYLVWAINEVEVPQTQGSPDQGA